MLIRVSRRFGEAIRDSSINRPMHNAALLLLLLTGCRKEEIVGLTWGEVRGARIFLDDSKTGARVVHLCSQAQGNLSGLKRGKPVERVFKGHLGGGISMDDYWNRIRLVAKLGKVRIHDIRHSYASLAARKSLPLPTMQRLLGHARLDSTARYTHFVDGHLIEIAQQISDIVEKASSKLYRSKGFGLLTVAYFGGRDYIVCTQVQLNLNDIKAVQQTFRAPWG